ncbi:Re/Si-specific NAD(P)(+) transhydrogenase subunit alpha [Caldithrix abyssi]|uniref:NAD(P) transhydrogenase subunit alpha part 1 n=1 Tax=Caldithrix abyssi DSM 13497 TaxID=880073 RepID=H1XXG1_CALAY|nr:Re/Si-specific NAD(P)(+) transhydrogenase subunit alpha [Caldithrix abyssi]APF17886.1 NAD(P) transhydrogenase subunit alpha [Caldithrix abyssi DSM 13497]EHO41946.1 alanine dehydrogenase/PNT domain protein [Caldithrix abyssi DSM 13497]
MKVGIPKEIREGETRVALVPAMVSVLTKMEHEVLVQKGAGESASFADEAYEQAGAQLVDDAAKLYEQADVVLKVQAPTVEEAKQIKEGGVYVGFLAPLANPDVVRVLAERKVTAFALEFVPRISRAQSMDALSAMATVAGYKAVLLAANMVGKMFPLLMTAAGTIPPANVLVLGAGVAGLQAIATARRLGARVEAFDPRPAVREQVQSLGATFIEMELPEEDVETEGGYAKEQSEAFLKKEQEAIAGRLSRMDVVVTTAQIFGKRAPLLITEEMVKLMPEGAAIIDLAAEQGGNCELTEAGKTVEKHGVKIYGAVNLPAMVPVHASQMYSKTVTNLFKQLFKDQTLNFEDEITLKACITRDGEVVNELIASALKEGGR